VGSNSDLGSSAILLVLSFILDQILRFFDLICVGGRSLHQCVSELEQSCVCVFFRWW
jgi:hypothetical protein